jgi:hypothetical protein
MKIRKATRVPAQRGIVTVEPASGTFVSLPDQAIIGCRKMIFTHAPKTAIMKLTQASAAPARLTMVFVGATNDATVETRGPWAVG